MSFPLQIILKNLSVIGKYFGNNLLKNPNQFVQAIISYLLHVLNCSKIYFLRRIYKKDNSKVFIFLIYILICGKFTQHWFYFQTL